MYNFSQRSLDNLAQCHVDLKTIFEVVILFFDCSIICGHRGQAEQTEAFNAGKSKLKYPQSKHNQKPSMAVDAVPYPVDWNDTDRMRYFAGHVMAIAHMLKQMGAISHDLRWGGDWNRNTQLKDNTFNDLPHFELI